MGYADDMRPAVEPPLAPMLARLERALPVDGYRYEPKWDGFRCLAFRAGADVDLRSRNDRPLARYFPETVAGVRAIAESRLVLDGELVVATEGGFDFGALMARLHPAASKVATLAAATPATFVVFDLLARGDRDLRSAPFVERRAELEDLLAGSEPRLVITPITDDVESAQRWLDEYRGGGVDGVVAKQAHAPYQPGRRAMTKVKHEETADCVVAGFRWYGEEPVVGSLLLGMYEGSDLRHVGVATSFTREQRSRLVGELAHLVIPLSTHPWAHGFALEGGRTGRLRGAAGRWTPDMGLDWVALRPELVCEVAYDQLDGRRLRNPGRFRRWRPDRDAKSCRIEQLDAALGANPLALLGSNP
jgi:ATP-dependent DNA ligase